MCNLKINQSSSILIKYNFHLLSGLFQISNVKSDIRKYLWIWHVYSMYLMNLLVVVYVCHVCHLSIFVKQTFNCLFLVKNEMSKNLNIIDIDRHIAFYHFHYSTNFNQYPYLDNFKTSLKLSCKNGSLASMILHF